MKVDLDKMLRTIERDVDMVSLCDFEDVIMELKAAREVVEASRERYYSNHNEVCMIQMQTGRFCNCGHAELFMKLREYDRVTRSK